MCLYFGPHGPPYGVTEDYRSGIWLLCASVGFYNVFNSPPADWTTGIGHLF